ncbi:MAG: hypothetical protein OXU51_14520 [Candidatus Poribacteria bacterium]|nr:hypothetical protein [Candidatus Poribacteria bacterium]
MQNSEKWSPALMQPENSDITTWELPEDAIARLAQGRGVTENIAPSPDGKYLAVGSCIGIWWYDMSTMTPIALWDTARGYISAVSFSPNGKWLATGDGDGLVKVWDVQNGICISQMERDASEKPYHCVSRFAFSPDSQCLAVSSIRDYILYIWHPETGEQIAKFHGETNFRWFGGFRRPIAFSGDGNLLACTMPDDSLMAYADRAGTIRTSEYSSHYIAVWDMKTSERIACLTEPTDFTESLFFSPCGQYLASGERDGAVRVWTVDSWKLTRTFQNYGTDRKQVFYSSEGVLYAAESSNETFAVWDVERGEKSDTYLEEHYLLQGVHTPKGTPFVLVSYTPREFLKWTVGAPQPRSFSHLHTGVPFSLVFASDGKTLAGGYWNEDEKVMLWNITQPSSPPSSFNLPGKEYTVSASTQGKIYATGPDGKTAKVWDIGNNKTPVATFTLSDEKKTFAEQEWQVSTAAFAPTSNLLACGDSEGTLYVWDVQQQHTRHTLKAHQDWVHSITFSPDEKLLASITRDGPESRLWDVESGEAIETFPDRTYPIIFSPCNRMIAGGGRPGILLWDVKRAETLLTIPLSETDGWLDSLAFSPCSRYLASGSTWRRGMGIKKVAIRLWNVASGENIATFRGHPTDIQCLAFSPDGTILASGGYGGTIMLWDVKPYTTG